MAARVGIRELRQNASAVIRRAAAGETIEVTDRGRPVARIVPLRAASVLDQMVAEGRATRAKGNLLDHKPLPPVPGKPLLSEILAEMRRDER
ncbi:MAG: type II toxin-antitoxin system prevent-host-death family antitoxin [Chloroflexi bacterium]|nr:MAG: type II toxin-antitoxin system prevent-host-death family antitoxin [Chloroflexota bacterium]